MSRIDLNVDLGEGMTWDAELMVLATTVNICGGAHAGSPDLTRATERLARGRGLRIVAHPGLDDPENFGRVAPHQFEPSEILASLIRQIDLSTDFWAIKPHGAIYNASATDPRWGDVIVPMLRHYQCPLVGLEATLHAQWAAAAGVRLIREGFAERGYTETGTLIPRGQPGAELTDEDTIVAQAERLAPHVDTVCVHGDRSDSPAVLRAVRDGLIRAGWEIGPCD